MHVSPLPLSSNSEVYVQGDVSIDPSAVIAPGVILQAAPDSKIIIAAGVCIGMGAILQAQQGTLEVETGAILGAGVLVVGKGKIGANACIGAIATIWNYSIEPGQVLAAGSLVGDMGRQIANFPIASPHSLRAKAQDPPVQDPPVQDPPAKSTSTTDKTSLNGRALSTQAASSTNAPQEGSPTEPTPTPPTSEVSRSVSGQGNLNRLLKTLFPHEQSIKRLPGDVKPLPEDD